MYNSHSSIYRLFYLSDTHSHTMSFPILTDYLTRCSESIALEKPTRLARLFSQTSDPIHNVFRELHADHGGRGVDKGWLEGMVRRRGGSVGLGDEDWRVVVLERIWAGWMEEQESWIEA